MSFKELKIEQDFVYKYDLFKDGSISTYTFYTIDKYYVMEYYDNCYAIYKNITEDTKFEHYIFSLSYEEYNKLLTSLRSINIIEILE